MSDVQRGRLMLIAASTLGACLVIITICFGAVIVRSNDGEAVKLISDNLWQLALMLAAALASIIGISHLGPTTTTPPSTAVNTGPSVAAPSDPSAQQGA